MTNTQKLLELAAQSINLVYEWKHDRYWGGEIGVVPQGYLRCWNPLDRDDDTVQLISELKLNVKFKQLHKRIWIRVTQFNSKSIKIFEPVEDDCRQAMRSAVVRAAAAIQQLTLKNNRGTNNGNKQSSQISV